MSTIQVSARIPIESGTAESDIAAVQAQAGPLAERREIEPATARAIASWWQSSGTVGHVLASFASGVAVDRTALLDDIAASRHGMTSAAEHAELDVLATFVINYQRED